MVSPENDKVIKSVSRKLSAGIQAGTSAHQILKAVNWIHSISRSFKSAMNEQKHYFDVKRLEDGFDLSGIDAPKLDHPPLKSRPTLNYGGLHDRPLKHYFGDRCVRVRLTNWTAPPNDPKERRVRKRMVRYLDELKYVHPYLPEYSYIHYPRGKMILRPDYQGFGVQLPKTKQPHIGGYPLLRSTTSHQISNREAKRLVNTTTKLIVNSQCMEESQRGRSASRNRRRCRSASGHASGARSASGQRPSVGNKKSPERKCPHKHHHDNTDSDNDHEARKKMPAWLKREIKKRDMDEGEDIQKRYVRPGSSVSDQSGHVSSGRHSSGRPGSGHPSNGHFGSGRPDSGRPNSERPGSGRPESRERNNGSPTVRYSKDHGKNVSEDNAAQTDLDLIIGDSVFDRVVSSGVKAKYRIFVRTGMKLGASTDADVFITLFGTKGRSEEFVLADCKNHKAKFRKSQEDEFHITTYHVGELKHVRIGHNRKELGSGWYLESVVVIDLLDRISYTFPCERWLSYREEDKLTKRVLQSTQTRNLPPDSELTESEESQSSMYSSRSSSPLRQSARTPTPSAGTRASSARPSSSSRTSLQNNPSSDNARLEKRNDDTESTYSENGSERRNKSPYPVRRVEAEAPRPSSPSPALITRDETPSSSKRSLTSQQSLDYCIHTAAKNGDLQLVKNIVDENDVLLDAVSEDGYTALHIAAANGHTRIVRWLARAGANVNAKSKHGMSVAHLAAQNGHLKSLKVLQENDADLEATTTGERRTPLHLAAACGFYDCCNFLVECGVDPSAKDRHGVTASDLAGENDHVDVEKFLTEIAARSAEKNAGDENLTVISEETSPLNGLTFSRVAEASPSSVASQNTARSRTETQTSSTPRIDLARNSPVRNDKI